MSQANQINLSLTEACYSQNMLIEQLVQLGYFRVPMVTDYGEFSVKGDVIDVFASNQSHAIRLEFDFDALFRMSSFDVLTQLSLSELKECLFLAYDGSSQSSIAIDKSSLEFLSDYQLNDYVVHEDHGVGQYKGLIRLNQSNLQGEYIQLSYKDGAIIYIALDQINRIHPYSQADKVPTLSALYKGQWQKTKTRVLKQVNQFLEDIYHLHQKRQRIKGFKYQEDSVEQLDFENAFEHKLTVDQEKAVEAIKSDMQAGKVMDRLLCGDVGYGKTEVMFRAVFKTVEHHQQVIILAPTSLLAQQHYQRCLARFKNTAYIVAQLSRFVSDKDQKELVSKIKKQQVDIIIGTHRVLSEQMSYQNLGLLVIDEEQRFGVLHKEKIKRLREQINVLSLSATPIPRTLYSALTGAKDISKIETAPVHKKPVNTTVTAYSPAIVKDIVLKEIARNGQVYYVYNQVASIQKMKHFLQNLLPDISIDVAHGQLSSLELHQAMCRFCEGETQVLICSTIIENGLDISAANTIIVHDVQNFGLSQLHQLRGRVGRGRINGYCYLLYSDTAPLKEDAKKRLEAIKAYQVLGSGYQLALKDLEIRGAGSIFGDQQHGHIYDVGFSLYCKMIESGIKRLQSKDQMPDKNNKQRVFLDQGFVLPESYIDHDHDRLSFYKTLKSISCLQDVYDLKANTSDRYGKLPKRLANYFEALVEVFTD